MWSKTSKGWDNAHQQSLGFTLPCFTLEGNGLTCTRALAFPLLNSPLLFPPSCSIFHFSLPSCWLLSMILFFPSPRQASDPKLPMWVSLLSKCRLPSLPPGCGDRRLCWRQTICPLSTNVNAWWHQADRVCVGCSALETLQDPVRQRVFGHLLALTS